MGPRRPAAASIIDAGLTGGLTLFAGGPESGPDDGAGGDPGFRAPRKRTVRTKKAVVAALLSALVLAASSSCADAGLASSVQTSVGAWGLG